MKLPKQSGKRNLCGEKIREARKKKKLSQEELAVKLQNVELDLTQKMISRIEARERVVSDYELVYFAKALDITVYELLGLEEGKK